jgi:hypothetical protein
VEVTGDGLKSNRQHKASVFASLFREYPRELPKLLPLDLPEGAEVRDVTLDDVLFMNQVNDLALLAGPALLLFFEHQSTISYNLCIRLLMYCARTYEKLVDRRVLYQREAVTLPRPYFFVLYNGKEDMPDAVTQRLSDMFAECGVDAKELGGIAGEIVPLELTVTVLNINKGRNLDLISRSEVLGGYVEFIDRVTRYREMGLDRSAAIARAVRECIEEGILREYLQAHGSEVSNMLLQEWDMEEYAAVRAEEARKEGEQRGELRGEQRGYERGRAEREALAAELARYKAKYEGLR